MRLREMTWPLNNGGLTPDRKHNSVLAKQLPNVALRLPTWNKKRRRLNWGLLNLYLR